MFNVHQVGVRAVLLSLTASACLTAADSRTDALIQSVEQHYNRARTLTVQFVEDYSVQGRPRPAESGTLTLRKQGKMRWDYAKPAGKLFISDGKTVYLYTAADNKVEEIPLKDTEDMRAPLAFLLGHLDLKKEFRDFQVRPATDHSAAWLDAEARSDKTAYENIRMLIGSKGEIEALTIVGRDTSRLDFRLSGERVNPTVNDTLFTFRIPPGAEVVHAVDYVGEER